MRRILVSEGAEHRVRVERSDDQDALTVRIEGDETPVRVGRLAGSLLVRRERRTLEAAVSRSRGAITVEIGRARFTFDGPAAGRRAGRRGADRAEVRSPMPGKVVRILRQNGDRVEEGDGVLVYEAMKMQNEIRAPASGVISNLGVAQGSPLEGGETLFVVAPPPPSP